MERTYTVKVVAREHDVQLILRDECGALERTYTMTMQQARALAMKLDTIIQQMIDQHGAKLPVVSVGCVSGDH